MAIRARERPVSKRVVAARPRAAGLGALDVAGNRSGRKAEARPDGDSREGACRCRPGERGPPLGPARRFGRLQRERRGRRARHGLHRRPDEPGDLLPPFVGERLVDGGHHLAEPIAALEHERAEAAQPADDPGHDEVDPEELRDPGEALRLGARAERRLLVERPAGRILIEHTQALERSERNPHRSLHLDGLLESGSERLERQERDRRRGCGRREQQRRQRSERAHGGGRLTGSPTGRSPEVAA